MSLKHIEPHIFFSCPMHEIFKACHFNELYMTNKVINYNMFIINKDLKNE